MHGQQNIKICKIIFRKGSASHFTTLLDGCTREGNLNFIKTIY